MKNLDHIFRYKLDYLIIVLLSFPILFLKLGSFSLRLWDESIYATNSIEMMERGEWIVPYFNGEMDYWNTKPPMIHWLQIISMKFFGINEFAIRFPSALAGMLTILLVYAFMKKHFNALSGIISSMVLLTTVGFVSFHGARTGDTDVILALFNLTFIFIFLDYLIEGKISNSKILFAGIVASLAFLTKSFASFIILPPVFMYIFITNKKLITNLFSNKYFWFSITFFLLSSIGFILLRNAQQPGYANLMFGMDAGLLANDLGKHHQPFFFYFDNLFSIRMVFWFPLAILSFIFIFIENSKENKNQSLKMLGWISLFFLSLISFSYTKLAWYDIPMIPIFAIAIGYFISTMLLKYTRAIKIISLALLFLMPYKNVFGMSQSNHFQSFEMQNEVKERYLKDLSDKFNSSNPKSMKEKFVIYHDGYKRSLEFYKLKLNKKYIADFNITNEPNFKLGQIVWVSEQHLKNILEEKYEFEILKEFENLNILKITKQKSPSKLKN